MSVKQISVFLENRPGTLQKMTAVLAENKVNMRATSLAETKDFGIARIIVDDEEGKYVLAEVVGFKDGKTLLMPFETTEGIGFGCVVENMGYPLSVPVGPELLGMALEQGRARHRQDR